MSDLCRPLFVSYFYKKNDGNNGYGYRVLAHDFIINSFVGCGEDVEAIRNAIIEGGQEFEDIVILNFRRLEP